MILEMENGGIDVENFIFNSADQSLFAFLQVLMYYILKNVNYLYFIFLIIFITCTTCFSINE